MKTESRNAVLRLDFIVPPVSVPVILEQNAAWEETEQMKLELNGPDMTSYFD